MNQLILVVEDDATMQKMALKILRSRGFSCELARSGREAVAMASALKPALILMDLSLPEMNGWEATRALKADPALAHIPVVAITAHAMVGDREQAGPLRGTGARAANGIPAGAARTGTAASRSGGGGVPLCQVDEDARPRAGLVGDVRDAPHVVVGSGRSR